MRPRRRSRRPRPRPSIGRSRRHRRRVRRSIRSVQPGARCGRPQQRRQVDSTRRAGGRGRAWRRRPGDCSRRRGCARIPAMRARQQERARRKRRAPEIQAMLQVRRETRSALATSAIRTVCSPSVRADAANWCSPSIFFAGAIASISRALNATLSIDSTWVRLISPDATASVSRWSSADKSGLRTSSHRESPRGA